MMEKMHVPASLEALEPRQNIHFIGIGGCGMSGVALCLRDLGYAISGSDACDGPALERLQAVGIALAIGHNGGNVPSDTQLVVASAAVKPDNPEYMAAVTRGIPVIKYARMLGLLMGAKKGVAVAGTHGKTTTTAMLSLALRELDADPSFVIGGSVPQLGGGSAVGASEYLVAEACEFDRSFLSLEPFCGIVNNIEEDHLDYYRDLDEIIEAFRHFVERIPPEGFLACSASSPNIARILDAARCRVVTFALEAEGDYVARKVRFENGRSLFSLETKTEGQIQSIEVTLETFGRHNVINALGAIAVLHNLGFPLKAAAQGVGKFRGVKRRFERIADRNNICIVDDYAHHPTEIRTVLKSSRIYFEGRRIICVFQPHQHSRTRFLLKDFARSFENADLVIIPDIYFVRDSEQEKKLVHARDLVRAVVEKGGNALYIPAFEEIEHFLGNNLHSGDVLLTMGAGNVWKIAHHLAEKL